MASHAMTRTRKALLVWRTGRWALRVLGPARTARAARRVPKALRVVRATKTGARRAGPIALAAGLTGGALAIRKRRAARVEPLPAALSDPPAGAANPPLGPVPVSGGDS
jgi:hypothetical protein